MHRIGREAPLPGAMQGRWIDVDDPSSELTVIGGEVTCYDQIAAYDYKEVDEVDGVLTVTLKVDDEANEDSFQRASVTGLALTPDGALHAWNVKFASEFARESR